MIRASLYRQVRGNKRSTSVRGRYKAQSFTEFVMAAPVFFVLLILIIGMIISLFSWTSVNYQFTNFGFRLPDGWEQMDDKELVRDVILQMPGLDPDRITIESAEVTSTIETNVKNQTPTEIRNDNREIVTINGLVKYKLPDLLGPFSGMVIPHPFHRTFVSDVRIEQSETN